MNPKSPRLWQKQLTKHLRQEQWLSVSTCLGCNQEETNTDFGGMVSEQKGLRNDTIHGMRCISKIQNDL